MQDFVAFFLAAGEAFVHTAVQEFRIHSQHSHLFAREFEELKGIDFAQALMLALCVDGCLQKVGVVNARDFNRILKAEKYSLTGTFLRLKIQQVFAVVLHFATGYDIVFVAGDNLCKGAFAGAVRSHDGVHLASVH